MPPIGVLMSTCLSSPFFSFCTFTLQADNSIKTAMENPRTTVLSISLRMRSSSLRNVCRTLQSDAALRDIRNRNRQVSANRNLAEKRLDRRHFRDRRIRERAHVVFDLGE